MAKNLINIRESDLNEIGVFPVPNDQIIDFLKGFKPTPADEKFIEAEGYIKPFPYLKLKGSKGKLIFKFLGIYISSNHDLGNIISI